MCGRFVGYRNIEELQAYFPIDRAADEVTASYNIAPTQQVLAIVRRRDENRLEKFHWGLVPFWAPDLSMGSRLINARAETVDQKPSFRNAFKKRRCLIPADGFYEWQGTKGRKQPYYFTRPDKKPFAFAGLWEEWNGKDPGAEAYRSCAIITLAASPSVKPIHHRMPAIIKPSKYDLWLDPGHTDPAGLKGLLAHGTETELVHTPVSPRVNTAAHNEPGNIAPLEQMEIKF